MMQDFRIEAVNWVGMKERNWDWRKCLEKKKVLSEKKEKPKYLAVD